MPSPSIVSPPAGSSITVLLVEDDAPAREGLKLILEGCGYSVIPATDGIDGIRKFADFNPDLVLTDIRMPKKGGISLVADLRRMRPDVKIIAMSGECGVDADFVSVAMALGADLGLYKPFDADQLTLAVHVVLGSSAAVQSPAVDTAADSIGYADEGAETAARETADLLRELDDIDERLTGLATAVKARRKILN